MRRVGNRIIGGALIAWLLALVSCGTMPMAPELQETAGVKPGSPASQEGQGAVSEPRPPQPIEVEDGVKVVKSVQGSEGDTLHVGGVTLMLPPNAFEGTAEITVTIPDTPERMCRLEIYPPNLNHFDEPVRLEFDVRGSDDPRVMAVFWFDETAKCWVPLTTTIDMSARKIWTDLAHFSIYKADSEVQTRAGW